MRASPGYGGKNHLRGEILLFWKFPAHCLVSEECLFKVPTVEEATFVAEVTVVHQADTLCPVNSQVSAPELLLLMCSGEPMDWTRSLFFCQRMRWLAGICFPSQVVEQSCVISDFSIFLGYWVPRLSGQLCKPKAVIPQLVQVTLTHPHFLLWHQWQELEGTFLRLATLRYACSIVTTIWKHLKVIMLN
jgi:hypothetical protein